MKKLFALVTACVMLMTGCASKASSSQSNDIATDTTTLAQVDSSLTTTLPANTSSMQDTWSDAQSEQYVKNLAFYSLDDKNLNRYIEDTVYHELVTELGDDYFVENVETTYISKEYLEELKFNSQANLYFGYTEDELTAQFVGTRYVFTLSDEGETTVKPFEPYVETDQTFNKIVKNVAIGTGVILLCVTVSVVSAGVGAPAVSMIFAASAKTATTMGLQSGLFGGLAAGIVTGVKTGDFEQSLKAAALAGSEGFKWGAITGAIAGGVSETINVSKLKGANVTENGLTLKQAEIIQKESKFPLDVIKQFQSMEEYNVYKNAGLSVKMINGKAALLPNIDWNYKTVFPNGKEMTNLDAVLQGYSPFDTKTGTFFNCHHIGQKADATLAVISEEVHKKNYSILHTIKTSEINRREFDKIRKAFWESVGELALKGLL